MLIGIHEARPGMTLAEEIKLPRKAGVIEKSRPITDELIALLKRHGIRQITITDPASAAAAGQTEASADRSFTDNTPSEPSEPAEPAEPAAVPLSAAAESAQSAPNAVPPRIEVTIADDAMSAKLIIEPVDAGQGSSELSQEMLVSSLKNSSVVSGVNEKLLADIVLAWRNSRKHYEYSRIAEGTPPQPGKEGLLYVKQQHLSVMTDVEVVRKSRYYWQAAEQLGRLHRVTQGAVLAEKMADTPPQAGVNVKGEPLTTDKMIESAISLRENVSFSSDRRQIIAGADGVLYYLNETIGILPLNFNGSIDLSLDKMTARLVLHPPGEGGTMPSEETIRELLSNGGVKEGIDAEAIAELVRGFEAGLIPQEPVVAAALPPVNGDNGTVEFLFNTKTSLAPKINPDGTADYRNVDIIISVSIGQELARLIPPTRGTPGKTIFGEVIPCKEGVPAKLPVGPNTAAGPTNPDVLLASIDGIVRYTGSHVEVHEGCIIKGDVDFSVGNIKYEKSVVVGGDIKTGFTVECGGDLQVAGIIEDSTVTTGGNILCKHGFIGQGKGIIEAKGDVNIGFILNQTIKSKKNVNIAREAINSTIYARSSITVHGKPLSIAGGTLIARESITLHTVGNISGVRTDLEVGLDYSLLEELKKNEDEELTLSQQHHKLAESIKKHQYLSSIKKHFSEPEELLFNKIKLAISKIEEQVRLLQEQKKILRSKLHELENAYIRIEHSAMPGTLIKIGEQRHILKDEIVGPKTVRLVQSEITII